MISTQLKRRKGDKESEPLANPRWTKNDNAFWFYWYCQHQAYVGNEGKFVGKKRKPKP